MSWDLEEDLARWERGEISRGELAARHPEENTGEIVSLHARLTALAAHETPDATPGWKAVRSRLQDRPPRALRRQGRRIHRPIVVAAAIVVLAAGAAFATEPVRRGAGRILDGLAQFLGDSGPTRMKPLTLSAKNLSVYGVENTTVFWIPSVADVDQKRLECAIASAPAHGHAWVSPNCGDGVYIPDPDFYGVEAFTYAVSGGTGEPVVATVAVTIAPVNDPPIARNDVATTKDDTPVTIEVLANDTDVEGSHLEVVSTKGGSNGSVTNNGDGTLTYTPDPDFNGVDAFTYAVSDGTGEPVVATVTITVAPVNDAPIGRNDVSTEEDTPLRSKSWPTTPTSRTATWRSPPQREVRSDR
jgi:Bacterial Ig domain